MSETGTESEGQTGTESEGGNGARTGQGRGAGTAVVVGAGVGGLATAVGLRRAGWEVTVLERRTAPERYGTAFGIHPSAQGALDRLGLGDALRARAVPYRGARIRRPDGRVLAALPLERIERRAGRPELLVSRPHLIDALLAGLDRLGGVRIAYGQQLADPAALDADLVVGADGINSVVRGARFGGESGPRPIGTVAWIGIAGFETGLYGETWGAGRFFGMTPVEAGRTNWYATVPEATTAQEVREAFANWHDPIPRVLAETDPATWIRYEMRHLYPALPTFVADGRIALVGDAAHAMTPNLGQGACTALLDAEALTRAVSAAGSAGSAGLPGALRAYDTERRRSAQRVAFGSRNLHRFMTGRRPALRDALVRLLPKN
ncbi:FAD-dependent oxidoreductase [Streptomyces avidinii]|uniref:2-polyprenyl-6-methoxyphenol hydroxylase-like FAD-dependent oxidoreductase n=1 Tax=Streptomyces avidinii TaxID=1895 RepID=A0ABS4L4B0_STRAV|nr:NAD(P)/FAD-dependent oxidoreductase [Streptomyces avidinii]MBP2036940.1 2-polyprenyl-6-methoxyphenol hydroxylase-like FAD-dependent oxidoreductase [Streptomyces avidinii]GGY94053.1 monooxygenase [Streptomyces avidinii]